MLNTQQLNRLKELANEIDELTSEVGMILESEPKIDMHIETYTYILNFYYKNITLQSLISLIENKEI